MGRRRLIKTLSGLGVSGAALASGGFDEMAAAVSDDTDRVPRVESYKHTNHEAVKNGAKPEREPTYYTIPRDEWIRTEAPYDAAASVQSRIGQIPFISVRPKFNIGGTYQPEIVVSYQSAKHESAPGIDGQIERSPGKGSPPIDFDELRRRLPDEVDGNVTHDGKTDAVRNIPVRLQRDELTTTAVYNSRYRAVPGGCQISRGNFERATICTPAYDPAYDDAGWVTAGHVFDRQSGTDLYQPTNCCSSFIGESTRWLEAGNGDSGFFASNGESRKLDIAKEGENNYMGWEIEGIIAKDRAKDMASRGEYIYRQGRTTGRTTIKMKSIGTNPGLIFAGQGEDEGGDSGGPLFTISNQGGALILGNHQGHYDTESVGTAMWHTEEELGILV